MARWWIVRCYAHARWNADYQAARERAIALAEEQHLHMVQPYHYDMVRGVATYWLELFSTVKDIDVATSRSV
jgi:threonine dehydratase